MNYYIQIANVQKCNTITFSDLSFWLTYTMKTEPWQWTLDASSKVEKSDLLRPHTENYRSMKAQIEKAVSGCTLNIKC